MTMSARASYSIIVSDDALTGEGYAPQHPALEAAAGDGADAPFRGPATDDGLWLLDMVSGETTLLLTLARLWAAVTRGPLSGGQDPLTGLQYHHAEAPPPEAARRCLHWVSDPQAREQMTSASQPGLLEVQACLITPPVAIHLLYVPGR